MAKMKFGTPSIISALNPGEGEEPIIGGGTGTGIPGGEGDDPNYDFATFENWLAYFEDFPEILDGNNDGLINEDDWIKWLSENGYEALIPKP